MWAGPLAIGALLLLGAGLAKARNPSGVDRALRNVGLALPVSVLRAGAVAEVVLGAWALLVGGALSAALVAASYAGFSVFLLIARRSPEAADCGCFGRSGGGPTVRHLTVDVALALGALAAALTGAPGLVTLVGKRPGIGAAFLVVAAAGAWLAAVVIDPPGQRPDAPDPPRQLVLRSEPSARPSAGPRGPR